MTTTEHLSLIKQFCERNLALKRTKGKWIPWGVFIKSNGETICSFPGSRFGQSDKDADFIAACAGGAEAGWKATIAAVDGLTAAREHHAVLNQIAGRDVSRSMTIKLCDNALNAIRTAYPLELVTL